MKGNAIFREKVPVTRSMHGLGEGLEIRSKGVIPALATDLLCDLGSVTLLPCGWDLSVKWQPTQSRVSLESPCKDTLPLPKQTTYY